MVNISIKFNSSMLHMTEKKRFYVTFYCGIYNVCSGKMYGNYKMDGIGKLTYIVQGLFILIKVARLTQTKW